MLKRKKNYTAIFIIIITIAVVVYYNRDKDITYSDLQWNCDYVEDTWICKVTFEIENHTHEQQERKLSIRGVRIPFDRKLSSLKICGEKIIEVTLHPKETKMIIQELSTKKKPNEIQLNMWK